MRMNEWHWTIPAKTFLMGEYAALAGESALLLTTTPHFELSLTDNPGLHGIHPDSPAFGGDSVTHYLILVCIGRILIKA